MKARIVNVGNELLTGEVVNTNAAYLAAGLADLGAEVESILVVPDQEEAIRAALDGAAGADLALFTGGLGPTADDLTAAAVARGFKRPLALHAPSLRRIQARCRRLGKAMEDLDRRQALIPKGAEVLANPAGMAPGFRIRRRRTDFFFLPGVPAEMEAIFLSHVALRIRRPFRIRTAAVTLKAFGLSEARADLLLAGMGAGERDWHLGFRIRFPEVHVRITAWGLQAVVRPRLERLAREAEKRLGGRVFARGKQTMAGVVGSLLRLRRMRLAVAESCTGGLLSELITREAGSSEYFDGGVVTYSNEAKLDLLGVRSRTLRRHGAVSPETAREMAEGLVRRRKVDAALAITGIAGPGGGGPSKPIGTVCIGLARRNRVQSREFHFSGRSRDMVRLLSAYCAMDWLIREIKGL